MDEANIITTRLLTRRKRKRPYEEDDISTQENLNKRKSIQFRKRNQSSNTPSETEVVVKNLQEETTAQVPEDIVEEAEEPGHNLPDSRGLYETKPTAGVTSKEIYGKLSPALVEIPEGAEDPITKHTPKNRCEKRRRINERLAHAANTNPDSPPEDVQDQGFTRPSVVSRFLMEYGLPAGAVDKLAAAEPGTYSHDHVETFKGNVDDNFRCSEFYGSDAIIASPLGLRRSIEKEKFHGFSPMTRNEELTSIEILINWDHVKFVLSYLTQLPKESHNTDFSWVKQWHLNGQYVTLPSKFDPDSAYDKPSFYNSALKNVAVKTRTEKRWHPVEVPEGIGQNFILLDCSKQKDEADKRFHHFTTQARSSVLKSGAQSTNAAIFVSSSFDFIRIQNKHAGVSFTVLSEYSTNQDIARARLAFLEGKKLFLLVSERFLFYRLQVQHLYNIGGIRNLIFDGLPLSSFTELLSYPCLDDGVEPSDYDWFRLERIAGTDANKGYMKLGEDTFFFSSLACTSWIKASIVGSLSF
ncbi:Protein of unknown function (DUF1253) domain containing protein [Amanita muscaria]